MESQIRVLLAEDHPIVYEGVRDICAFAKDISLVGIAENSTQIETLLEQEHADVILLDLDMPSSHYLENISLLRQQYPDVKILIFTAFCETIDIAQLIDKGIQGYILKSEGTENLLEAIRWSMANEAWFSSQVLRTLRQQAAKQSSSSYTTLSLRETQILELMAQGDNNEQIAAHLNLAKQTVANHVSSIYEKLEVMSRAEAILWWLERQTPPNKSF